MEGTLTISDSGWGRRISMPSSNLTFYGSDAVEKLVSDFAFDTILDVGCGDGAHTKYLRDHGKKVTSIDLKHYHEFEPDIVGDYLEVQFTEKFDAIWCCHVLEHTRNPGTFLDKIYEDLKENGILAVTVPPLKHNIVSGHMTLWNGGLLLYQLILSGFDCGDSSVKTYGYNISVILSKKPNNLKAQTWSLIDAKRYFPFNVRQGFDGRIISVNW